MKKRILIFTFVTTGFFARAQDLNKVAKELGQDVTAKKDDIESIFNTDDLSYGINKDGFAYTMREWNGGMVAWYFDDNSICSAVYWEFRDKRRKLLVDLKLFLGANATKIEANKYCTEFNLCYTFSSPDVESIGVLIDKSR
jgi:hypothetical protein